MNTDIAITPEAPEVHTLDFAPRTRPVHRKIAKLSKPLRDLINTSLDDGLPASQIIEKLQASTNPPLPYPISEVNISDWRKSGYQHYLNQEERLALIQANHEAALEMVAANDTMTIPEAGLQIIASQYFEFLGNLSPAALKEKLAEDPIKYTRFLNVFARLVREIVHLRKYRDASAKAAAEAQLSDPSRKPTAQDHANCFKQADAFFMHSPGKWCAEEPKPAPLPGPSSPSTPVQSFPIEGSPPASDLHEPLSHPSRDAVHSPTPESPQSTPDLHPPSIKNQIPKIDVPLEHCLECRAPLPPLTPEGKRPFERCENCLIILPAPGLCLQRSNDKCHFCGASLTHRLQNGRRPRPTCHNCGTGLGRELFDDQNQNPTR